MDAESLFKIANTAVLPFWLLLVFLPRHALTARLVRSGAVSCLIAALYMICLSQGSSFNPDAFATLANLRTTFQNEWFLLAGWLHYLAFDLFVGSVITTYYVNHGGSRLVLALELFFTLMLGPLGLFLHKLRVWVQQRAIQ